MSTPQYVLAFDLGTTSVRSLLIDHSGTIVALARRPIQQIFPKLGWVEHDPIEIWQAQLETAREVLAQANASANDVASIGLTNQRETVVVWEKATGRPIYNAIVWQCRRTAEYCNDLKAQGLEPLISEKTGLVLDAYFSASKLAWILQNVSGARAQAERGELCCGTIDSWIIYQLTMGKVHATDASNASRTMLFNLDTLSWDKELLEIFNVPVERPANLETTALGAAYLAGLSVGFWRDQTELAELAQSVQTFVPTLAEADRKKALNAWQRAVEVCRRW